MTSSIQFVRGAAPTTIRPGAQCATLEPGRTGIALQWSYCDNAGPRVSVTMHDPRKRASWITRSADSEEPEAPEARMALAADHQVVVDRDAERLGRLADFLRHLDVVARGLG